MIDFRTARFLFTFLKPSRAHHLSLLTRALNCVHNERTRKRERNRLEISKKQFESHQRLNVYKYVDQKGLSCNSDRQEVSRCCARGESEGSIAEQGIPRQMSPEVQKYWWPHKKDSRLPNVLKNKQ